MLTMKFFSSGPGAKLVEQYVKQGLTGAKKFTAASAVFQRELAQYLSDNNILNNAKQTFDETTFLQKVDKILSTDLEKFLKQSNIVNSLSNEELLEDVTRIYGIEVQDKALKASYTERAK